MFSRLSRQISQFYGLNKSVLYSTRSTWNKIKLQTKHNGGRNQIVQLLFLLRTYSLRYFFAFENWKKKNCYGQLNGRSRNCRLCLLAYYSCSLTWRSIRRFDLPFPVLRINTCCCHIIAQRQGAVCLHCYYTTLYTQYRFENTARADNVYDDWHCFRFELSISNHI